MAVCYATTACGELLLQSLEVGVLSPCFWLVTRNRRVTLKAANLIMFCMGHKLMSVAMPGRRCCWAFSRLAAVTLCRAWRLLLNSIGFRASMGHGLPTLGM